MQTVKSILLTGASGFLGSYLVGAFLAEGYKVIIIKRPTSSLFRITELIPFIQVYDSDTRSMQQAFNENEIDVVIHTACHYGRNGDSDSEILKTNVLFGMQILEMACSNSVGSFVNTHTLLPRDLNVYSLSKFQFLDWLERYESKIQIINIRPEHLYGPKDDNSKFVPWLLNKMVHLNEEIGLTTGNQKRDFIYVDDVVDAYVLILKKLTEIVSGSTFDIGTGHFIEMRTFVNMLSKTVYEATGFDPTPRLKFGAIPYRINEIMEPVLDNSKLVQLGWEPKFNLKEGITKTVNDIIV